MDYSIAKVKLELTNDNGEKAIEEPFYFHQNVFMESGGNSSVLEPTLIDIRHAMEAIVDGLCESDTTLSATHLIYDTIID